MSMLDPDERAWRDEQVAWLREALRPWVEELATQAALAVVERMAADRIGPRKLPGRVTRVDGSKAWVVLDVDANAPEGDDVAVVASVSTKWPVAGERVVVEFDERGRADVVGIAGGFT